MYRYDQLHPVSDSTSSPLHMFRNNLAMATTLMSPPVFSSSTDMTNSHYLISPSGDGNQSNIDHITCLERSLCSNFHCCGAQLPDLHALLDHFEEDHIMVLAPNGKRVYPREGLRTVPLHSIQTSFTNTTPASSRASSISPYSSLSSPSSSTPSTPSDFSSPATGPFGSRKSGLTTATVPPVYTPFTPSLPVDPAYPYPDTEEITALHEQSTIYEFPAGVDAYPSMLPPPIAISELMSPLSSSDEDEDMEMSDCSGVDMPASPGQLQTYVCAQGQSQALQPINTTPKKNVNFAVTPHRGRPSTKLSEAHKAASPSASKSKGKNRHLISGPSASSRRREKLFHCPSYLNPNGLKYHMEKGTCNIEGEGECLASPGSGDVDTEIMQAQLPRSHAQGTSSVPTPTGNVSRPEGSIDAEPRTHSKSQFILPNPKSIPVRVPYYRSQPSAEGAPAAATSAEASASDITTSHSRAETPWQPVQQPAPQSQHQNQNELVYHYPVPSYPQLGGPNALLAGYTTFMHRSPFFSSGDTSNTDGRGSHSSQAQTPADADVFSPPIPLPPPPSAISASSSSYRLL